MNAVNELKVIISAEVDKLNKALGYTKKKVEETKESIEGTNKTINKSVSKSSNQMKLYTGRLIKRFFFISLILRPILKALETFNKLINNGLSNVYKYSSVIGGDFAKNIDSLRDSLNYYGNSIAAVFVPTLNAMIPVLTTIIDRLADFNNRIAEMSAYLHNQPTYLKAVKKEGVETFNVLLQNYQKLKRTVAGFDELNIINNNNDVNDMFTIEETAVEAPLDGFLDKIKEVGLAIKDLLFAPFRKIGEEIEGVWNKVKPIFDTFSDRFNKIFNSKFETFIDKLREIFDPMNYGILSPFFGLDIALNSETFEAIVNGIPTALGIWVQLATTIKNVLAKIGEIVKNILDAIGKPIDNAIANVFNSITDWYENKGGKDIIDKFGKGLLKIIERIATVLKGIAPILNSIGAGIGKLINDLPIIEMLDGIIQIITHLSNALSGLLDILIGFWSFDFEKLSKGITSFFGNIGRALIQVVETVLGLFVKLINNIIFGIRDAINFMIRGLNNISIDWPDWLGGGHWGFDIKELDWSGIPSLDTNWAEDLFPSYIVDSPDYYKSSEPAHGKDRSADLSFIGSTLEDSIKQLQEAGYLNSPDDIIGPVAGPDWKASDYFDTTDDGALTGSQNIILEVDGQALGRVSLSNINRLSKQAGYVNLNLAY